MKSVLRIHLSYDKLNFCKAMEWVEICSFLTLKTSSSRKQMLQKKVPFLDIEDTNNKTVKLGYNEQLLLCYIFTFLLSYHPTFSSEVFTHWHCPKILISLIERSFINGSSTFVPVYLAHLGVRWYLSFGPPEVVCETGAVEDEDVEEAAAAAAALMKRPELPRFKPAVSTCNSLKCLTNFSTLSILDLLHVTNTVSNSALSNPFATRQMWRMPI
jgi:hypothetical protein